jgi:hypothetical protein
MAPDKRAVCDLLDDPREERAMVRWRRIAVQYEVADPSIFKFVCRHCGKVSYKRDSH